MPVLPPPLGFSLSVASSAVGKCAIDFLDRDRGLGPAAFCVVAMAPKNSPFSTLSDSFEEGGSISSPSHAEEIDVEIGGAKSKQSGTARNNAGVHRTSSELLVSPMAYGPPHSIKIPIS